MDALQTLLDKIKETRSLSSDAALARVLDVKPQTMSNWRKAHNLPDAVACARIAELSGEPLARVLGVVGEARALSREEKAVWRRLAQAAAVVLMVATAWVTRPGDAEAKPQANQGFVAASVYTLWINPNSPNRAAPPPARASSPCATRRFLPSASGTPGAPAG